MSKPTCEHCIHAEYDIGDRSVGLGPSWDCTNEDVDPDVFDADQNDEYLEVLAATCGHYEPVPAGKCGVCGKDIGLPKHAIAHWYTHYYGEPNPCCSEDCAEAGEEREEWEYIRECRLNEEFEDQLDAWDNDAPRCPHGNLHHECGPCMAHGDFLADCAREARHFGRR